jgi:hypothetical protein
MDPLLISNRSNKRHQLLPKTSSLPAGGTIKTKKDLIKHLQWAMMVEHSTIPAYLFTLYTISENSNPFAYNTIRSVVLEEMLHMVQAANILNAVGGEPVLNHKDFIPTYPAPLPHSSAKFEVALQNFRQDTLGIFLDIEHPGAPGAPPQGDNYDTIGQFYEAVKIGLVTVAGTHPDLFDKKYYHKQVTPDQYYGSGGQIIPVYNLEDAIKGINEIVGQGEGMDHSIEDPDHEMFGENIEYAHYFKFNEVLVGRRYQKNDDPNGPPTGRKVEVNWEAVLNVQDNPKMADYKKGSPMYERMRDFNRTYMSLLQNIEHACNGKPELLMKGIHLMYDLKYKALELMNMPNGNGQMAGPSFEFVKI